MIMSNNSSNGNLLSGEIKKELSSSSSVSSNVAPISQTTNQTVLSSSNTNTSSSETKIETSHQPKTTPASNVNSNIDSSSRWIFSLEKIENSPSRLDGISKENELTERQEAALFINDLGTKLKVNQLCINTAIIYMHRFYMIHSLKKFHHYVRIVATSCLFFACKVEEQPRRLREFIDIVQSLFHKSNEPINHNSEEYKHYGDQIMALESSLIQTLGFNVLINHAHTVIIKTCQMIKAPRDLAEAAYLTATNSLILTDFCVKFSSERVACFCIYLACKWTGLIIPMSSEGMQWYEYVNHDIKEQELEDISKEYLAIYDKCSNKIKRKLGITKNQDEINPQLHPKHGQQQTRKPSQPHPNQTRLSNQGPVSNVNTHSGYHSKQYQSSHHGQHPKSQSHHPVAGQQNGFHPSNSHQYGNQQYQHRQHQQQQQQQRSGQNINKQQANSSGSMHPNSNNLNSNKTSNPTSKNLQNPSTNSTNHNKNFSNGNSNGSSSQSHPTHNLTNQTGVSSSNTNFKNNTSLNSGNGEGATNYNKNMNLSYSNNGHNNSSNPIKKPVNKESSNSNNFKQMNGSNNNNSSNNLNISNSSNNKSSPSAPQINNSMKRTNEEISNVSTAPNKIPKYVIDQKSAS